MKRTINNLILFVFLATCIAWINCGDDKNPLAPMQLAGTWNLVTFTNKEDNFTATAGQPTDIGNGVIFTITGTLVITETRYIQSGTQTVEFPGLPPQTENFSFTGTYSVSGSTLTAVEDGTGEINTFTVSLSGDRLTLEDDEVRLVLEKQ